MLDYDDYVTIKITKVKDEVGKFLFWEQDTQFSENWYSTGGTGPDFHGVVDMVLDQIREVAQFWTIDNANGETV